MRDLQLEIDQYLRRGELVPALRLLAAAVDQHVAQVNFRLQRLENSIGMGHAMPSIADCPPECSIPGGYCKLTWASEWGQDSENPAAGHTCGECGNHYYKRDDGRPSCSVAPGNRVPPEQAACGDFEEKTEEEE